MSHSYPLPLTHRIDVIKKVPSSSSTQFRNSSVILQSLDPDDSTPGVGPVRARPRSLFLPNFVLPTRRLVWYGSGFRRRGVVDEVEVVAELLEDSDGLQ